jgi:hypothetical protein
MKRAALLLAVLGLACASGGAKPKEAAHIEIRQLVGPSPVQSLAQFDVQFAVDVENLSSEPFTIKQVDVRQIGSGTYSLTNSNQPAHFDQLVAPGESATVTFWMHARPTVMPGDYGATEPVTVRAVVYFRSEKSGQFRQVTHRTLPQFND